MHELSGVNWDVVILSETWRGEVFESFETKWGHRWYGSGGKRRSCGVGFLVHKRWAVGEFIPVNERLASPCVQFHDRLINLIAVYVPDTSRSEEEVDAIYYSMSTLVRQCRKKSDRLVIAGDFNAEVGSRLEEDDPNVIGMNAMTARNARGEDLLRWCACGKYIRRRQYSSLLDMLSQGIT